MWLLYGRGGSGRPTKLAIMYFDPQMAFGFLEGGNGCGFETSRQLSKCRTLWGEREQAAQWFEKVAELEQTQNRCCQHHLTGKQRVATAVFS